MGKTADNSHLPLKPFIPWKVQWQIFYVLSSEQSCETVILLLKARGTPAITPEKRKIKKKIRKGSYAGHTDTDE